MGLLDRKEEEEIIKIDKNKVSNNIIENVIKNKDLITLKMIYYIISLKNVPYIENGSLFTIKINLKDFLKDTNISKKSLFKSIDNMQKTIITYKTNDKIEKMTLIPRMEYNYNNILKIDLFNKVYKTLKEVVNKYTYIDLKKIKKLNNINSIRFIPILEMIHNYDTKQKTYDLEELNDIFETKYKTLKQIETFILKPLKKNFNNNSNITFEYEPNFYLINKTGRPSLISYTIKPIKKEYYQSSIFTNFDNRIEEEEKEELKNFIEYFEEQERGLKEKTTPNRIIEKYKIYKSNYDKMNYKEFINIHFLNGWR